VNPSHLKGLPPHRSGAYLAIVHGMDNRTAPGWRSFVRVIRAFVEGSLVAFGFAFAILAVGTPIVLIIRGLHEGLSWLARLVGDPTPLVEALVSISSVAGGVILTAVFIRLLVRFFQWRRRFRIDVMTGSAANARRDQREVAQAA
jgi:hypothetical protein